MTDKVIDLQPGPQRTAIRLAHTWDVAVIDHKQPLNEDWLQEFKQRAIALEEFAIDADCGIQRIQIAAPTVIAGPIDSAIEWPK